MVAAGLLAVADWFDRVTGSEVSLHHRRRDLASDLTPEPDAARDG